MTPENKKTDWKLLLFLLLLTNQAVFSLKVLGLVLMYVLRPDFNFGIRQRRLPLFYLYIIGLSVFTLIVKTRDFSGAYMAAFAMGNFFWLAGFLTIHQVKLSIERYGTQSADRILRVFTVLNLVACVWQLVKIMNITGTINPYSGLDFPYGMSTGDNIYGIFLQNSYYNMMVSAMLAVYFIFRKQFGYAIVAGLSLVLVFGNYGTMIFMLVLCAIMATGILKYLTANAGNGKLVHIIRNVAPRGNYMLYIPTIMIFVVLLYAIISPENTKYVVTKLKDKVYAINTAGQNNYVTMIDNQKPDPRAFVMSGDEYEKVKKSERESAQYLSYSEAVKAVEGRDIVSAENAKRAMTKVYIERLQGKTLALLETWQYLKGSPANMLLGAGTTRFSSLMAQKMAGYDSSRLFMNVLPQFISPDYRTNHLLIIVERTVSESKNFSNANWPDSFYNQLLGEYGMAGVALFLLFYVWYFVKQVDKWTYGFWIFLLVIPFAHLTYLFEALCVIPFFELLMMTDMAEKQEKREVQHV